MTPFTNRLVQLRKIRGLTQQQIADKIGINRGSYSNWEKGKREPNLENIIKIAKILNTTTDYLLGLTDISERELKIKSIEKLKELGEKKVKEAIKIEGDETVDQFMIAFLKEPNRNKEEIFDEIAGTDDKIRREIYRDFYWRAIGKLTDYGNNSETTETK